MRKIKLMKQFKRDYKKMLQQPFCTEEFLLEFETVIDKLAKDFSVDTESKKYYDHPLKGDYKNCRELHLLPDWLLIYSKEINGPLELLLMRTGSHQTLL